MSGGEPGHVDVSYVTVNWNAGKYLPSFLESLRRESEGFSYELILVDNGSTDGSLRFVREHHPWVTVLRTERNLGFAGGNNLGIRESTGRFVCLVNPDVVFLPGCMEALLGEMAGNPRAGITGPKVFAGDGGIQRSVRPFPTLVNTAAKAVALERRFFDPYRRICAPTEVEVMNGCFWLARREALLEVGLLDESFFLYSEDMDWCRRFALSGWKVVYVPAAEIIHYGGGSSSLSPVRFYLEMRRANLQYWRKYHSKTEQRLFLMLTLFHQAVRYFAWTLVSLLPGKNAGQASFKRRRSLRAIDWLLTGSSSADVPVDPSYYDGPAVAGKERA